MKRFVSFAGSNTVPMPQLRDCIGDFHELRQAKEAVEARDPDDYPIHEWGAVLDLTTGMVFDWTSGTHDHDAKWFAPRPVTDIDRRRSDCI